MNNTAVVFSCALRDYLSYDPETGHLYFTRPRKGRKVGEPAGCKGKQGYIQVTFMQKQLKAHRIAWFLHYGEWPNSQVDHINGDKSDNRIKNLRVGASINQHNRKMPLPPSGVVGAGYSKTKNKYRASVRDNGKVKFLGYFNCPTSASLAYLREKERILNV